MVMGTVHIYIALHDNVDCVFVFYLIFLLKFINSVPSILNIYLFCYGNVTVMINTQK